MREGLEIGRYRRFKAWDYSRGASLFITITTSPRRKVFGEVVGGDMQLSELGAALDRAIADIPKFNRGLKVFGRVVMPDHLHFNCALEPGLEKPLMIIGNAIRRLKNYIVKKARFLAEHSSAIRASAEFGEGLDMTVSQAPYGQTGGDLNSPDGQTAFAQFWQQGYHDYLLVSRQMIDATERYIAYNPLKWSLMYGTEKGLRIKEPLFSPRLSSSDYWKGVGNLNLLGEEEKMVSLRVSREVNSAEKIAEVVRRMENAVKKGYVIISGFISKGECVVRDMLLKAPNAKFIRVLPSCLPNKRFKPESAYVAAFAEGRYLEIARGNDERSFSRSSCLDVNAEIVEIATAGAGLALYWKKDGPHIIRQSKECSV